MKRMLALLLLAALLCGLCSCGDVPDQTPSQPEAEQPAAEAQEPEPADQAAAQEETGEPEGSEPQGVTVTLYYGDDNAEKLLSREETVAELTPQVLADLLYAEGVFSHAFAVNRCEVEDGIITLDLDEHFEEMLQSTGTAGEYIMMGSLVNTFL